MRLLWKRFYFRQVGQRLFCLALLGSCLFHLLGLVALQEGFRRAAREELHTLVSFYAIPPELSRFRPLPPLPGAGGGMERLASEGGPAGIPSELTEYPLLVEGGEIPGVPQALGEPGLPEGKAEIFVPPPETLVSLAALNLAAVERYIQERTQYERRWILDADTSDAESQRRRQAQGVVQAAIAAMGGISALSQVRGMSTGPLHPVNLTTVAQWERSSTEAEIQDRLLQGQSFYKSYGLRTKYAQYLPGGGRLVYDGDRAWVDLKGYRHEVEGEHLQTIQNRVERWDFLSRYLGEGVVLDYLGDQEKEPGQTFDVVQVEDRKFGGVTFRGFFDCQTHLLAAEEYPAERPVLQKRFLEYGRTGKALLWTQVVTAPLERGGGGRDTLAVDYRPVPDSVFALAQPEAGWQGPEHREHEVVVWVDAAFTPRPYRGQPVITEEGLGLVSDKIGRRGWQDTTRHYLNYQQKSLVEAQIRQIAAAALDRSGWFARVQVREKGEDLPPQDYLLRVWLLARKSPQEPDYQGRVFYGAEFSAAGTQVLMRDGPIPDYYFGQSWGGDVPYSQVNPECRFYRLPVYMVDERTAYVSEAQLEELLRRTCDKAARSLQAHQQGAPLLFDNPCCYCQDLSKPQERSP